MNVIRWIFAATLVVSFVGELNAATQSLIFKEKLAEKIAWDGATSGVLSTGAFALTAKIAADGFDPSALNASSLLGIKLGTWNFQQTLGNAAEFNPAKQKAAFVFTSADDQGKPVKWLSLVVSWKGQMISLRALGRTRPFLAPILAGAYDGQTVTPISATQEGSISLGDFQKTFQLAMGGKAKTRAKVGKDARSHNLSTIALTGKGAFTGGASQLPIIEITSPVDGSVAPEGEIEVTGSVAHFPSAGRIELNGVVGQTAGSGAFTFTDHALFDGTNELTVRVYSGTALLATRTVSVQWHAPTVIGAEISPVAGGALTVADDSSELFGAGISVPAGAVSRVLRGTIQEDPEHLPALPFGIRAVGPGVVFGPVGEVFAAPVRLIVPISPSRFPAETVLTDIRVLAMTDSGWTEIPVTGRSPHTVEVQVTNLAFDPIIAVISEPLQAGELRISSDPPGASIYLDDFNTGLQTPASLSDLAEGAHNVKLYLRTFNEASVDVEVPLEGTGISVTLGKPTAPVPQVTIIASIVDGMTVTDNIFTINGTVSVGGSPATEGRVVISQNGEDYFSGVEESGAFSEVVSLLPGENTLEVRFTSVDGNTGVSRRVRVINLEGAAALAESGAASASPPAAVAPAGITVVLSWDTDETDIDLHVFDPQGRHASYDALDGIPDAALDHDDTDGFGPETFTMLDPRPGTYTVRADYYSGDLPTTARLNIYRGSELIFSESYLLSLSDGNATEGLPGDPDSIWDAHSFVIGELEIERLTTVVPSAPSAAIFTTGIGENEVVVRLKAPPDILESDIRLEVQEVSSEGELWPVDTSGVAVSSRTATVTLTNRTPTVEEFTSEGSQPLKYRFIARTADGRLESEPKELVQERISQIRQEYVDKRAIHSQFVLATPSRSEIVDASGFPADAGFSFADFAGYSDFSPSPAVVHASVNIAETLNDAWAAAFPLSNGDFSFPPLRVTSGWRNPRRNDRLPDSALNSFHQTGNAVDMNPSFTGPWPVVVPYAPATNYSQAQRLLKELAHRTFGADYTVLLHGSNPHVHIQRNGD
ncbi:MAG: hypothetical protein JWQ44_438 [Chthoniobacter sp.]|nr:hypothetical protein [Chthoniobacter sp.]